MLTGVINLLTTSKNKTLNYFYNYIYMPGRSFTHHEINLFQTKFTLRS